MRAFFVVYIYRTVTKVKNKDDQKRDTPIKLGALRIRKLSYYGVVVQPKMINKRVQLSL